MLKLILTIFLLVYNYNLIVKSDKVSFLELASNWRLTNENGSIEISPIKVPSGVYSAIRKKYGDILKSKNDVSLRWVALENWTYALNFSVDPTAVTDRVNLTFHGIDTIATIRLNNEDIGYTDNMFVRYSYDVTLKLKPQNNLQVIIMSPIVYAKRMAAILQEKNLTYPPACPGPRANGECHRNMIRKMQMSFGDDWNLAALSMGLWKSVTLERYELAIMRDVDVAVQRNDTHWTMDIRVFISTAFHTDFYAELLFYAADLLDKPYNVTRQLVSPKNPKIEFKVPIPKDRVKSWWPNGYGAQKLYPLFFTINCYSQPEGPRIFSKTVSQKKMNFGFRTIELVEDKDDFGSTFYFKVNGHAIFMKGVNYIPSHILPEETTQSSDFDRVNFFLHSAKNAHMNMIRVWGGGLYESDHFYNLADYYGLMVWQDMTFYRTVYPVTDDFVDSVRKETIQNAKRLSYHPSLAFLVTNDEIELYMTTNRSELGSEAERYAKEYSQLFAGTIRYELNIISRTSFQPRPGPMLSTPSNGLAEKGIPANPSDPNYGDVHLVEENKINWDVSSYPWARFVSEYGIQSLPIKASWRRVLGANDTIADLIAHRQHHKLSFEAMKDLLDDWENNVEELIYLTQVAQATAAKTASDLFRSNRMKYRTMGALYWQLNDVWVAPTWSSIDFYGNYKMLYYWSKEFLKPIAVIALYDANQRAVNVTLTREDVTEYRDARVYNLDVYSYLYSELFSKKKISKAAVLDSNSMSKEVMELEKLMEESQTERNSFFEFVLSEGSNVLSTTFLFPASFAEAEGIQDPQLAFDIKMSYCNSASSNTVRINSFSIIVTVMKPALFVYIELNHPLVERYRLSENGFIMVEPIKTVHLEFEHESQCIKLSNDNITVHALNKFKLDLETTTTMLPETTIMTTDVSSGKSTITSNIPSTSSSIAPNPTAQPSSGTTFEPITTNSPESQTATTDIVTETSTVMVSSTSTSELSTEDLRTTRTTTTTKLGKIEEGSTEEINNSEEIVQVFGFDN